MESIRIRIFSILVQPFFFHFHFIDKRATRITTAIKKKSNIKWVSKQETRSCVEETRFIVFMVRATNTQSFVAQACNERVGQHCAPKWAESIVVYGHIAQRWYNPEWLERKQNCNQWMCKLCTRLRPNFNSISQSVFVKCVFFLKCKFIRSEGPLQIKTHSILITVGWMPNTMPCILPLQLQRWGRRHRGRRHRGRVISWICDSYAFTTKAMASTTTRWISNLIDIKFCAPRQRSVTVTLAREHHLQHYRNA